MVQDPQTDDDNNTVVGVAVDISENRQQMTNYATLTPIYNFWIHIFDTFRTSYL